VPDHRSESWRRYFPGVDYLAQEGRWGIGSDSHVSLNVVEELRWLEYGQRLRDQRRNRLVAQGQTRVGDVLYTQALSGGAQACGAAGATRSVIAPTGWCLTIRTLIWLRQATTRYLTAGYLPVMPVRFAMFMLAALRGLLMGFILSNRPPRLIFCNCCNSFLRRTHEQLASVFPRQIAGESLAQWRGETREIISWPQGRRNLTGAPALPLSPPMARFPPSRVLTVR
jgi:formimidoylglutamate deiminase